MMAFTGGAETAATEPIQLHPDNPHYFLWRGRPTVLVTAAEHYGAVLNPDFNYRKYLKTLESQGLNLTRIFSGAYCEPPGAFRIRDNTLAPAEGRLLCPWARSDEPGYAFGGSKFDLQKWDPVYFRRLRSFVAEADGRGVVVEVVLFCTFYDDSMWNLSPMNAANNVNGIGAVHRSEVHTLKHPELLAVQEAMARKIVQELSEFDNVYYEICNEPYERDGQSEPWQDRIAEIIVRTEAELPRTHLIAQGLPWREQNLPKGATGRPMPGPHISVLNFHAASPPTAVERYYDLNKVIAYDETPRRSLARHRAEAWEFIIAGGAVYDHLDLSFAVGAEDGTAGVERGGRETTDGPELRRQLGILKRFIEGFDFVRMSPRTSVIRGGVPEGATGWALAGAGRAYAIYINGGSDARLSVALPAGRYAAEWINTKSGSVDRAESFEHPGGDRMLASPRYTDDIALRILGEAADG